MTAPAVAAPAKVSRGKVNGLAGALATPTTDVRLERVRVDQVDIGDNVRKTIDQAKIDELAASIKEHGVLSPIKVLETERGGHYQLVYGQSRLLAARKAGLVEIPALVRFQRLEAEQDSHAIEQLVENIVRADLNPIDEARALRQVLDADKSLTQAALAKQLGRSEPWVANTLRLLGLDPKVQRLIVDGQISQSHGKAIASLPAKQQRSIASEVVSRKMSAKDLERSLEWKRQEAENDEAKGKRTAKILPKILAALEAAKVAKGATVHLSGQHHSFDIDGLRNAVAKAGYKTTDRYLSAAPATGCDCQGTYIAGLNGRGVSVKAACEKDHWRRAEDRKWEARNQANAAAEKLLKKKLKAVATAIAGSLIDVPATVLRLVVYMCSRYSYPAPTLKELTKLDSAALQSRLTRLVGDGWRMDVGDVDILLAELGITVDVAAAPAKKGKGAK